MCQIMGAKYRGLVIDHLAGQLPPDCVAKMVQLKRIPIVMWGHLAPRLEVAGSYQDELLKEEYRESEAIKVAKILENHPDGAPRLTEEEILRLVSRVHKSVMGSPAFCERSFCAPGRQMR